ncbi:MAG: LPS export ABC transporter periplasmic protein LptC [Bacteroidales bacterium]|nr:LPS export ABC transporter periplasmic protein LptC [Bacteroidales bacterium]MCR4858600.1 LPS export ABC transporter periplasmic protein LptC [Bacteroidales bacterium]
MMFFIACHKENKSSVLYEYEGKFPDESAENMVLTMSDSGMVSFILETPLLNRYYGDTTYADFPKGIKVVSYNEYGQRQAMLTADYAIEINNTQYTASKNVVIVDLVKGDTLKTEEIQWNQLSRTVRSDVLVKQIKADGSVNYGDGFTADDRFTKYTIIHPRGEMAGFDF